MCDPPEQPSGLPCSSIPQAALAVQPLLQDSDSVTFNPAGHGSRSTGGGGEGGVNGGAVAGIVLAATIGVAALLGSAVLALRYVRWRRHWLEQQQQVADALSSKGGDSPRSTALSHDMDGSRHGGSVRGGSQHGGTALPAHLLRSDSRNGGSRNGGVSRLSAGSSAELPEPRASFAHGSIEPHGSVELTGSKVPSSPKAAATVPPGHAHPSAKKLSEWELLSAFAKSVSSRPGSGARCTVVHAVLCCAWPARAARLARRAAQRAGAAPTRVGTRR